MKIEDFERASKIISKIRKLTNEIVDLKGIISEDTTNWRFEVRRNMTSTPRVIDHCGVLPDALDKILRIKMAKLEALTKELDGVGNGN